MKHHGRTAPALFGAASVALAVGLSGAGALLAGMTATAITPASYVASAPSVAPVGSQGCIIGLNCGCIRHRTCPGDRRPRVRTPEPQLERDIPIASSDQGVAADLTRTPAWASPSA